MSSVRLATTYVLGGALDMVWRRGKKLGRFACIYYYARNGFSAFGTS